MTSIRRIFDKALGRWRDPYVWELSPAVRGLTGRETPGQWTRDGRRAHRDANTRARRSQRKTR